MPFSFGMILGSYSDRKFTKESNMETIEHITALIIDDSPYIRTLVGTLLKKEGVKNISYAHNGEEGIKMFFETEPDIVFLDNIMPKTSGMEVLEEIRKTNPECKIVMMSSMTSVRTIEDSKDLGANFYLIKPFLPEKIRYVLDRFLKLDNLIPIAV